MGQSTDAILCWGIQLAEDDEVPWADDAEEFGYDDPLEPAAMVRVITGEKLGSHKANERLKELGIQIVMHGHYEDPAIIIAAVGSVTTAHRGYPQEVNEGVMDDPPIRWLDSLNRALPKLGIPDSKYQWTLCAWASC